MVRTGERLRIAVLYGAEPYQAYHVSDIAAALSRDPDVDLTILTVDPAIDPVLDRLEAGLFSSTVPRERLATPAWVRLLRRARVFGILKQQVLAAPTNLRRLAEFDGIVTPTTHFADLRDRIPRSTAFIYCYHGAGGRRVSYSERMRAFDLVLATGQATVDQLLREGLAEPGRAIPIGLVKLETCRRLARSAPQLF